MSIHIRCIRSCLAPIKYGPRYRKMMTSTLLFSIFLWVAGWANKRRHASSFPYVKMLHTKGVRYDGGQWHASNIIRAFEDEFYSLQNTNAFIANKTNNWILNNEKSRWPAAPIITGDGFRALADFICEPENKCSNLAIRDWFMRFGYRRPPIIYVKIDVLDMFAENVLKPWLHRLQLPFVLITHNGDGAAPPVQHEALLDDCLLLAWFGQNPRMMHPKLVPIPIGLENRYITRSSVETLMAARRESIHVLPSKALLSAFSKRTNPGIRKQLQAFVGERLPHDYATTSSSGKEMDWYRDIMDHRMILSPRGNGLDTHRTWEALYLGGVPVVVASEMDAVFKELPVIVLDSWNELSKDRLETEYRKILQKMKSHYYRPSRLSLSFYAHQIYEKAGREWCAE